MTNLHDVFDDAMAAPLNTDIVRAASQAAKAAGPALSEEARATIAGWAACAAFRAPDEVAAFYDALSEGWSNEPIEAAPIAPFNVAPLAAPSDLAKNWWEVVTDAAAGRLDAASITARTAALGALVDDGYNQRAAQASLQYPAIADTLSAPWPARIELATLERCPELSLGRQFHDLLVANNFDLEVLDRDSIGLTGLPKPLDWLNTRILQSHDLWHIVAGYETTALHEIAISAFQMAQFGHPYSAQFLSVTLGVGAVTPALGYPVLMETIISAWAHGRRTGPLMAIPWEDVWDQSSQALRDRYRVTPYASPFPPNLIEMMSRG